MDEVKLSTITNPLLDNGTEWYYEKNINSSTLTITAGDSWTWGDSLGKTTLPTYDDRDYRLANIYGNILSNKLDSDFINIGVPGGSNLFILIYLEKVLQSLTKSYSTVRIIFTLTESGRELENGFLDQQQHYDAWAGKDWPSFNEIINQTATNEQLAVMTNDISGTHFGDVVGLYLALKPSTNLNDLLTRYESFTVETIKQRVPGVILARNFTSMVDKTKFNISNRWTDVIADNGNLPAYPDQLYVMSQIGINPLLKISRHLDKNHFKNDWMPILEQATKGIDWLLNSPYNSKRATKHPLEQAHYWWAQHLYESLTT